MPVTDDPSDPRLTRGVDETPREQADTYLVLSDEERARGFVRPVRQSYYHLTCGAVTTMGLAIAQTYARQPNFLRGDLLRRLPDAPARRPERRVRVDRERHHH